MLVGIRDRDLNTRGNHSRKLSQTSESVKNDIERNMQELGRVMKQRVPACNLFYMKNLSEMKAKRAQLQASTVTHGPFEVVKIVMAKSQEKTQIDEITFRLARVRSPGSGARDPRTR